jgi:hypothetical protein
LANVSQQLFVRRQHTPQPQRVLRSAQAGGCATTGRAQTQHLRQPVADLDPLSVPEADRAVSEPEITRFGELKASLLTALRCPPARLTSRLTDLP